jgi:hypothetical protein
VLAQEHSNYQTTVVKQLASAYMRLLMDRVLRGATLSVGDERTGALVPAPGSCADLQCPAGNAHTGSGSARFQKREACGFTLAVGSEYFEWPRAPRQPLLLPPSQKRLINAHSPQTIA